MEKIPPSEHLKPHPYTLGFLASHNGSAMRTIIEVTETGELPGMTSGVVISENNSTALQFAKTRNIPNFWVNETNTAERDAQILEILIDHNVNLLICSGYMKKFHQQSSHKSLLSISIQLILASMVEKECMEIEFTKPSYKQVKLSQYLLSMLLQKTMMRDRYYLKER